MRAMRFTHDRTPTASRALMASATVEGAQAAASAIFRKGREAKAATGVVEAPQKRLQHVEAFGRQQTVMLALLGAPRELARIDHDPRLGVAVERARSPVAKQLFAAGP
jgi:hypothetical protein